MIVLELPWPPSVNHYWRHAVIKGRAQVYTSAEGKAYRTAVHESVLQHAPGQRKADTGRIQVGIMAYVPDRRARDLDNINKALLDALVHAKVFEDDSMIDRLTIERGPVVKGGKVRVFIEGITE